MVRTHDGDLMLAVIDHWVRCEPEAFADALEECLPRSLISFRTERRDGIIWTERFYNQWTTRDATAALARARKTAIWTRPYAVSEVLSEMFRRSPDEALAASATVPAQDLLFSCIPLDFIEPGYVLANLETVKALPESRLRMELLSAAVSAKQKDDPVAALELAASLRDPTTANYTRARVAADWVNADHAAARRYVEAAPDGRLRRAVARAVGIYLAGSYPVEGIEWAIQWTTGEDRRKIVNEAITTLERTDPAQAAAQRAALPPSLRPLLPARL